MLVCDRSHMVDNNDDELVQSTSNHFHNIICGHPLSFSLSISADTSSACVCLTHFFQRSRSIQSETQ